MTLTMRPPGWKLIADRHGTNGWHLVDSTTPEASVRTRCGLTGHVIAEDQAQIVCCEACSAMARR